MGTKPTKAPDKTDPGGPAEEPARKLTRATLIELYAARRHLGLSALLETGLRMPIEV